MGAGVGLALFTNCLYKIQSICVICRFRICEFACSLRFICKVNSHGSFMVTGEHVQRSKKLESPDEDAPS